MNVKNRIITVIDRNYITVDNVKEVLGFTDETVKIFTECGNVTVNGECLEVTSAFGNESNAVTVEGEIHSLIFDGNKEKLVDNFITKLFR